MKELYGELILDHSKNPRNKRVMAEPTSHTQGHGVFCGDLIRVFLHVEEDVIKDICFDGDACAICTASASLMTAHVMGFQVQEVESVFDQFRALVTTDIQNLALGKLQAFAGVKEYPIRVKCATLPWYTLRSALQGDPSVSLE